MPSSRVQARLLNQDMDDRQLVTLVHAGNTAALGALYDRYAPIAYRCVLSITLSADDAEDVVQEVFVDLPNRVGGFAQRGTFAGWIRRVAAREALSRLRTERRRARLLQLVATSESQTAPPSLPTPLEDLLTVLNPDLRAVVVLKELEGCSHREVAAALGISVAASKVRLHRAMRQLRRHHSTRESEE